MSPKMKIIYKDEYDTKEFDMDRYLTSLNKYGKVTEEQVKKGLDDFKGCPVLHSSVLWEIGTKVLSKTGGDAEKYYSEHKPNAQGFERLRRITGYLVGSLERWNDAKKSEERARVKHSLGQYSQENKDRIEAEKLVYSVASQI